MLSRLRAEVWERVFTERATAAHLVEAESWSGLSSLCLPLLVCSFKLLKVVIVPILC